MFMVINLIVFHIDVNSAFLSWTAVEMLKKDNSLDIRNISSAICGDPNSRHGIILAKSIKAKKYNIQTGETIYSALKKCPFLKLYRSDFELYKNKHNLFISLLKDYFPLIEVASIDECYIDYSCVKNLYGDELSYANYIKNTVYEKLGFTVNIGIGSNKFLAKMASNFSKPNKVHTLFINEISEKLWNLDIKEMYGVGKKSYIKLEKHGFKKIYDIAHSSKEYMYKILGKQGLTLYENANGIDRNKICSEHILQSISSSRTLIYDTNDVQKLYMELLDISYIVGKRLRESNFVTSLISVELKNYMFEKYSKQKKLSYSISSTDDIFKIAKGLFTELWNKDKIRNIGISLGCLGSKDSKQLSFFDTNILEENLKSDKKLKLDNTIDKINEKYNNTVLTKACLIQKKDV